MKSRLIPLFVLLLSASAAVPTPESHFGHKIGVDNELLDWAKVVSYFEALAKSSDRIKFLELGKTVEGRSQIAAVISSPANIRTSNTIARFRCDSRIRARLQRRRRR